MEPLTLLAIGSTALNIFGGMKKASAEKKAAAYNANILRRNASIRRQMAKRELAKGDKAEAAHRNQVADLKADQRARMLAGGQTLTGSNSKILDDTAIYGELDALTIRSNAANQAWSYDVDAESLDMEANLAEMGGSSSATSTLLTTGAQVASNWMNYNA